MYGVDNRGGGRGGNCNWPCTVKYVPRAPLLFPPAPLLVPPPLSFPEPYLRRPASHRFSSYRHPGSSCAMYVPVAAATSLLPSPYPLPLYPPQHQLAVVQQRIPAAKSHHQFQQQQQQYVLSNPNVPNHSHTVQRRVVSSTVPLPSPTTAWIPRHPVPQPSDSTLSNTLVSSPDCNTSNKLSVPLDVSAPEPSSLTPTSSAAASSSSDTSPEFSVAATTPEKSLSSTDHRRQTDERSTGWSYWQDDSRLLLQRLENCQLFSSGRHDDKKKRPDQTGGDVAGQPLDEDAEDGKENRLVFCNCKDVCKADTVFTIVRVNTRSPPPCGDSSCPPDPTGLSVEPISTRPSTRERATVARSLWCDYCGTVSAHLKIDVGDDCSTHHHSVKSDYSLAPSTETRASEGNTLAAHHGDPVVSLDSLLLKSILDELLVPSQDVEEDSCAAKLYSCQTCGWTRIGDYRPRDGSRWNLSHTSYLLQTELDIASTSAETQLLIAGLNFIEQDRESTSFNIVVPDMEHLIQAEYEQRTKLIGSRRNSEDTNSHTTKLSTAGVVVDDPLSTQQDLHCSSSLSRPCNRWNDMVVTSFDMSSSSSLRGP